VQVDREFLHSGLAAGVFLYLTIIKTLLVYYISRLFVWIFIIVVLALRSISFFLGGGYFGTKSNFGGEAATLLYNMDVINRLLLKYCLFDFGTPKCKIRGGFSAVQGGKLV